MKKEEEEEEVKRFMFFISLGLSLLKFDKTIFAKIAILIDEISLSRQ